MATANVDKLRQVDTLVFDLFGTVLQLAGSILPAVERFVVKLDTRVDATTLWEKWRDRQRIEQYQDSLMAVGHSGYLETCRRALIYCLRGEGLECSETEVSELMEVWKILDPFEDAVQGLKHLAGSYRLVALSNGDQWLLEHLVTERIKVPFDAVISADTAGAFKPHPSVYRTAVRVLDSEPSRLMMVAAHSFDLIGARACGYRAAYVNRYGIPFDETVYQPDVVVSDFNELASRLAGDGA
ncbi:MAG: haloacid dehalogenase type II [Chloroflexi bacterium]|nr:haloacid dehalogenase type II [Chloroflexota bacterium]